WTRSLLVRADGAVAIERSAHAYWNLLGRNDRFGTAGIEFVAAGHACDLFCVLSFVRQRGARFFGLSVGRNASGSGFHFPVPRARGIPAEVGLIKQAIARKLVLAGVGMLPDLL